MPVRDLAIRPATIADAALVAVLVREHAAFEQGSPAGGTAEDFAAGLAEGAFECLIAEAADRPLGLLLFLAVFSSWTGRRGLFVEDLFVRAEARGLGVGRRLMAELARIARRRGGTRIDLVVAEDNSARQFYRQLGLREVEGWRLYRADAAVLDELSAQARIFAGLCDSSQRRGPDSTKSPVTAP
jgi:ribosomal protein S18 acetylase RimI-like enzyme